MCRIHRLDLLIVLVICLIHLNSGDNYVCDSNLSCGCSLSSTSVTAKIIGGEIAADNAWGWALQLLKSGQFSCTAVLISNSYAVTAAHCVDEVTSASKLTIIAGTNDYSNTNGAGERRTVLQYYIHPNYNAARSTNDIAVLRFSPLTNTSRVKFICLPSAGVDPFVLGSNVVVAGWGVTNENSRDPSPALRQVTVEVLAPGNMYCRRSYVTDITVQMCAGDIRGGKGMIDGK